jgi:phosphate transport system substrate-binding protein
VVQAVATDLYGIGYSGIGYKTADVRAVPLAQDDDGKLYEAIPENAFDGSYPLARFLYIYVDKPPLEELDPLRLEFLKFVLSKEGQEMVRKEGYLPLPAELLLEKRQALGIEN